VARCRCSSQRTDGNDGETRHEDRSTPDAVTESTCDDEHDRLGQHEGENHPQKLMDVNVVVVPDVGESNTNRING
jgi:hypothetical protein